MNKRTIKLLACFIPLPRVRRRFRHNLMEKYIGVPTRIAIYKEIKDKWIQNNNGKKLLPARFDKYDVVFAIGAACPMSWALIAHKLRTFSNPFDWSDGISECNWSYDADVWRDTRFIEKITALCSGFKNYFNFEDMKMVSKNGDMLHHYIYNVRTKIRFIHLFPGDKSVESVWDDVAAKISRRCDRLVKEMENAGRVLICWGHRMYSQKSTLDAPVSDEDIKKAISLLAKRFPKTDIDIAFFEHDGTKKEFEYDKIEVCKNAFRIRTNHYIVTDDYECVCEPVSFVGEKVRFSQSMGVAEALDNIKLTNNV